MIANRYMENTNVYSSAAKDVALFFTAIIVISAYGLPIVLARAPPENPTVSYLNRKVKNYFLKLGLTDCTRRLCSCIAWQHSCLSNNSWIFLLIH